MMIDRCFHSGNQIYRSAQQVEYSTVLVRDDAENHLVVVRHLSGPMLVKPLQPDEVVRTPFRQLIGSGAYRLGRQTLCLGRVDRRVYFCQRVQEGGVGLAETDHNSITFSLDSLYQGKVAPAGCYLRVPGSIKGVDHVFRSNLAAAVKKRLTQRERICLLVRTHIPLSGEGSH